MALPLLINGADCGPVNPLQGLAKRFDHDRGVQQDQFVAGRAGPSREIFRTNQQASPALEQEAARFFGLQKGLVSPLPTPNAFDVSVLQKSLPVAHPHSIHSPSTPVQLQAPQASQQARRFAWATDFLQQARERNTDAIKSETTTPVSQIEVANRQMVTSPGPSSIGMQWTPPIGMISRPQFVPQALTSPSQLDVHASAARLEEQFQFLEEVSEQLDSCRREQTNITTPAGQGNQDPAQAKREADDLARTAAMLVETVQGEQNPKFQNSQFMRLMRGLRDGDVVVDGNDIVERSVVASDSVSDMKGKGKERVGGPIVIDPSNSTQRSVATTHGQSPSQFQEDPETREGDPNEAYFQRENEEYVDYWNRPASQPGARHHAGPSQAFGPQDEWGALQESWDSFEATTWGVKPVSHYQFQPHNPYLNGEVTRRHTMHSQRSLYESVLELEAQVQRDPTNARAWYDLGVKQQENEREPKAIAALNRALELDSSHLPTWLALAISYTNEGDRSAADDAVQQWVRRNQHYEAVVTECYRRVEQLNGGTLDSLSQARRHDELIYCLMAMARSGNERGEVDADVQIALAVLLNTSEDYLKAQDCFKAALSVRPDDWQLYNRVGATLANSGLSEEAFQYYYRALELNPAYIRARFNLGISCMNTRRYDEAAQYILDALIMQDSDGPVHAQDDKRGITSSTLWDSLRSSCVHLQRLDLAELCDLRDLEGFRRQFHV